MPVKTVLRSPHPAPLLRMLVENNHELLVSAPSSPPSLSLKMLSEAEDKAIIPHFKVCLFLLASSLLFILHPSPFLPHKHHQSPSFPPDFPFSLLRMLSMDAREARLPGTLRTAPPSPTPDPASLSLSLPAPNRRDIQSALGNCF